MSDTASSPSLPPPMQSRPSRVPFLDEMRGLAILAVFLLHALAAVCPMSKALLFGIDTFFLTPIVYGKYGVAMFFVISGFCIHMSHRRATDPSWGRFAALRFFRLYPAYFLAVLTFFFCWPWKPFSLANLRDAHQLWMHLGLVHNLDATTWFGINVSWWSIAVEVQLYAIYPLLCWIAALGGWHRAAIVAIGCELSIQAAGLASWSLGVAGLPTCVAASPFAFWGSWAIGAVIAEHLLAGTRSPIARVRFDVAIVAALVLGALKPFYGIAFFAFALATGVAMERLFSAEWMPPNTAVARLAGTHLRLLGKVSYSFYLFHQPIVNLTGWVLGRTFPGASLPPFVRFLAACSWYPAVLLLSFALYRLVEEPFVAFGKKLLGRKRASGPDARLSDAASSDLRR